jgi:hypothetical protein
MPVYDASVGAGAAVEGDLLQFDAQGVPRSSSAIAKLGRPIAGVEKVVKFPLALLHAGVKGLVNPFGVDVMVVGAFILTTTVSTGASTIDVGTSAVSIATASDNLLDGINGAVTAPNVQARLMGDATTNSKDSQYWTAGTWVTVGEASGDTTGFVGTLYLCCMGL